MKKRTKILLGIGVVAAVGGTAVIGAVARREKPVEVRIEAVTTRDLVASVTASGWIRPHRRVDVQSDVMGRIIELRVKEGEAVRKGQLLLRIDPTQFEAAVGRAQAAVSEAQARESQTRANLLQAQRAHERFRQLAASDQNLVSKQQLEEAETQVAVQTELLQATTFGVAQARSALEEARDMLSKTTIHAPMTGIITRLNVEEGSTAIVGTMNNSGSLLLTVADLSTMEAVVRVDETDLPSISLGDSAAITIDAFPRQKFIGRVTEIGYSSVRSPLSSSMPSTGQGGQAIDYEVVITLDNPPAELRSDLSVSSDIVTDKRPSVLSIPIIALTVRERGANQAVPQENPEARAAAEAAAGQNGKADLDEEGVFVVRAGKVVFVPVKVGIAGQEYFEVITGLVEKDSVVAGPYEAIRTLEEGKSVKQLVTPMGDKAVQSTTKGS